jgi:hypothetical protein
MIPALEDVRAWIQVPASAVPDPMLQGVLDAEVILQAVACRVDELLGPDAAQVQALYRRCGREVAARGVPLGMIGADAEYGPARLSRWDAEVDRLEGPSRVLVFG